MVNADRFALMLQKPLELVPKLFGPIRERYADRPGGYTRVLRIEPLKEDQAPSAILELVDGPKDMRFAMTARILARFRDEGRKVNEVTAANIEKVTRYRPGGKEELEELVSKMEDLMEKEEEHGAPQPTKKNVYPKNDPHRQEVW